MSTLKIISNKESSLYIDQQFVSAMHKGELLVHHIEPGVYLVDVISADEEVESFDVELASDKQQVLKRVVFDENHTRRDGSQASLDDDLKIVGAEDGIGHPQIWICRSFRKNLDPVCI